MLVRDLLTGQELACLGPGATVLEAARKMAATRVGSLLIADPEGRMLGIFTERDVMIRVVAEGSDPSKVRIEDVMTHEVYTTTPERTVAEVRDEMQDRHIRHVPVVQNDRVLAILGMRDLMRADLQEKRREVRAMTDYIRGQEGK